MLCVMDVSSSGLLISVIFGAIGMGYMAYAKAQRDGRALIAGLALCIFPYFVTNTWLMILVGAVITVLPYLLRNY